MTTIAAAARNGHAVRAVDCGTRRAVDHSVYLFAGSGAGAARIKVLEERVAGATDIDGIRQALKVIIVAAGIGAAAAVGASAIIAIGLDS